MRDLRIFEDADEKMNRSVADAGGALLVVSQFTLCGDCRKGRRPAFDAAAAPDVARPLYEDLVRELRAANLTGGARRIRGAHARGARQRRPGHDPAGQPPPLVNGVRHLFGVTGDLFHEG